MPSLRTLIGVLVLSATVLAGAPARAADDDRAPIVWAPYLVVGATTVEITDAADHPTWPIVTVYLRASDGGSCAADACTYRFQGPGIEPGESWVFDPSEYACSLGLPPSTCLPDGAEGAASFEPAITTGTAANAGATPDPDGLLAASVTAPSGIYDAVAATADVTLTDVARRVADADGATTAIRIVGAAGVRVDWYLDDELVAHQQIGVGSDCCAASGSVVTASATIDPRDVDGLDDNARYTVVITRTWGSDFAVVAADTIDDR